METLTTADMILTLTMSATVLGFILVMVWLFVCTVLYVCGALTEDRKESLFKLLGVGVSMTLIMGCLSAVAYAFSSL